VLFPLDPHLGEGREGKGRVSRREESGGELGKGVGLKVGRGSEDSHPRQITLGLHGSACISIVLTVT